MVVVVTGEDSDVVAGEDSDVVTGEDSDAVTGEDSDASPDDSGMDDGCCIGIIHTRAELVFRLPTV